MPYQQAFYRCNKTIVRELRIDNLPKSLLHADFGRCGQIKIIEKNFASI